MKRESLQSLLARIEYQSVVTKVCEKMLPNYNGKTFFFRRERQQWENGSRGGAAVPNIGG